MIQLWPKSMGYLRVLYSANNAGYYADSEVICHTPKGDDDLKRTIRQIKFPTSATPKLTRVVAYARVSSGKDALLPRTRLVSIPQVWRSWSSFLKGLYRTTKIIPIRKIIGMTSTTSTPTSQQAGWGRQTESRKYDEHRLSCPVHPTTIIISGGTS